MTVRELYEALSRRYPAALSAAWDNDGLMLTPDPNAPVRHVLCTLDATEAVLAYAKEIGADLLLSHHPMLFHPLPSVTPDTPTGRRVLTALSAGISVLSFHTRADAADGGVNDLLAAALGLSAPTPFGEGLGRIAMLAAPAALSDFCTAVRSSLGAPLLLVGDAHRPVLRVALVGGSGKDELAAAIAAGADTLLSGRLSYETVNEAEELGINLIEAGHFYTEAPLARHWAEWLPKEFAGIETTYFNSCRVFVK
ncbi:MAG: Nif3-like dinuclear metal center hexameric protein [Clostridia bacterium]|nr:Nif3-like dinuclear metal center hexameric protein [Clostridia bacterium]